MSISLLAFVHTWVVKLQKQVTEFRSDVDVTVPEYRNEIAPWLDVADFHLRRSQESLDPTEAMAYLTAAHQHWGFARQTARTLRIGKKIASSKAGAKSGETKREQAVQDHSDWIAYAKQRSANGKEAHELTGLVAQKFGKSAAAVRPVLQAAGLVETQTQKRARKPQAKKKGK